MYPEFRHRFASSLALSMILYTHSSLLKLLDPLHPQLSSPPSHWDKRKHIDPATTPTSNWHHLVLALDSVFLRLFALSRIFRSRLGVSIAGRGVPFTFSFAFSGGFALRPECIVLVGFRRFAPIRLGCPIRHLRLLRPSRNSILPTGTLRTYTAPHLLLVCFVLFLPSPLRRE